MRQFAQKLRKQKIFDVPTIKFSPRRNFLDDVWIATKIYTVLNPLDVKSHEIFRRRLVATHFPLFGFVFSRNYSDAGAVNKTKREQKEY